jgi:hypothetical protein
VSADQVFVGRQLFADVDALVTRLASLGEPAMSRARALGGATAIDIEMIYRVALLRRPPAADWRAAR